jgi:hypothetical protein
MASHGLLSEQRDKKELYKNILRVKKFDEDYTGDEVIAIKEIVYNPLDKTISYLINEEKSVILYGSAIFKGNVRAGDIDTMQLIPLDKQAEALKWIVNKLEKNDDNNETYFIGDIKCGINKKFKSLQKYIGEYQNGKIVGYDYDACKYSFNLSSDFQDAGLVLPQKIQNKNDFINYLKCYDLAHELITKRWTIEEIKDGFVEEEDGTQYSLYHACFESELTKLDMFNYLNNNFKEVTITLFDTKKKYDPKIFEDQLTFNMLIQYYAKGKMLKSLKRLYALVRMQKNEAMTLLLHDFTQRSIVGAYNSIINELKVIIDIYERHGSSFQNNENGRRIVRLRQHLGSIVMMIQKLYNPYYEEYRKFINVIDIIDDNIDENKCDKKSIETDLKKMEEIIDFFNEKIEIICKEFIKENKINFDQYIKF